MLRLGMPTLVEFYTLEENIALCKRLGLDFIELNMNLPVFLPESLPSEAIAECRRTYGIDFTVHLPEEIDLTSYHPVIRQGHLTRCKEAIEWAAAAGVSRVNMHIHNGIYFTLPDRKVWIHEQYEERFAGLLLESYLALWSHAQACGVQICIENAGNFHLPFIARGLARLSEHSGFALTWDVGHDAKADFREQPLIERMLPQVAHMHLHDVAGGSDHQLLYTGIVPIDERLRLADERQWTVVIETKTAGALAESVRRLRERYL